MIAVLLALSVSSVAAPPTDRPLVLRNGLSLMPAACRAGVTTAADSTLLRPADRAELKIRKLGDLPKAHHEIAINRTVMGCMAPVIVRYDVEGDGRAASAPGGGK